MNAIKFKFISRKQMNNSSKNLGIKLSAYAYYIINGHGQIISQIPQIIFSEYRRTDSDMIKTKYWNKKNKMGEYYVQNFRNKFLYEKQEEIEKLNKNSSRKEIDQHTIDNINTEFLNGQYSILTYISFLTGSNITGCDSNELNQPFFYIDEEFESEWNFFNPFNPFKKIRKNNNSKIQLKSIDDLNLMTFEEYFDKFKFIEINNKIINPKEIFLKGNELRKIMNEEAKKEIDLQSVEFNELLKSNKYEENNECLKKLFDYQNDIKNFIKIYLNNDLNFDKQKLRSTLRNKFTKCINLAIKSNLISYRSFEMDKFNNIENSHIISVERLISQHTQDSLFNITNPFNCLRLSPSIHTSYDKNEITFTPDGKIVGNIKPLNWISYDIVNHEKRKKFIEENYEYWKKYNKNL